MIYFRRPLAVVAAVVLLEPLALSQESDSVHSPESNLDLVRLLASSIGDTVGRTVQKGDSCMMTVTVLPRDLAWYVEGTLLQGVARHGFGVRAGGTARLAAEFGLGKVSVTYQDIRRQGFLGSKIVDRSVSLRISAKVVDLEHGDILVARDFEEGHRDTILLSDVERVEIPGLALTHGILPAEGLFSSLAEPLVMLGAIGVAVYLLFAVRS